MVALNSEHSSETWYPAESRLVVGTSSVQLKNMFVAQLHAMCFAPPCLDCTLIAHDTVV